MTGALRDDEHGSVTEILHAWALAPAAIGTCCLAADRRTSRTPEVAASALMLLAMLDSALTGLVPSVLWAGALLVAALGLAAARRLRGDRRRSGAAMTAHTAIGMIAMAGILPTMSHENAETVIASGTHAHGASGTALLLVLLAGSTAYAAASLVAAVRARGPIYRVQYAAMGASTLVMGIALIG